MTTPAPEGQPAAEHPRPAALVALLTFTSGGVDVVTLMVIGQSFTSIVTGNLILVGQAIGTASISPALHVIVAVAAYAAGVALGTWIRLGVARRSRPAPWPRCATYLLAAEWAVLAALNAAWIGYDGAPPAAAQYVLLAAAAIALGMQGAAARAIAGNPSTTYLTGALTGLVESLLTGSRRSAELAAALGLLFLVLGAACGAVLVQHARPAALLPPLAALAVVVLVKLREHHREDSLTPRG